MSNQINIPNQLSIIGVPMDFGQLLRGVANKTAELAVELTLPALGKSIL